MLMKPRASLLPVLVGVLVSVAPLAYTSPPDPSRIGGHHRGGRLGDLVVFLGAGAGLRRAVVLADAPPGSVLIRCSPQARKVLNPRPVFSSNPVPASPRS